MSYRNPSKNSGYNVIGTLILIWMLLHAWHWWFG